METMQELAKCVSEKARLYLEETGEKIEKFPTSIVNFVVEYVMNGCNFPDDFGERKIARILGNGKEALAMSCVDVYGKIAGEGELSHSETGISRSYESTWISPKLLNNFPNYVQALKKE